MTTATVISWNVNGIRACLSKPGSASVLASSGPRRRREPPSDVSAAAASPRPSAVVSGHRQTAQVTTRGPDGEKRLAPPLDETSDPRRVWARETARRRKGLLKLGGPTPPPTPRDAPSSPTDATLEISEVVLPAHQNHMGHTFGGVVMSWMHKAALVCASRHANVAAGALRTRGIDQIGFATGSDVSDHLIFRARVTAVFDDGAAAEVGVRVAKRDIATGNEVAAGAGTLLSSRPSPRSVAAVRRRDHVAATSRRKGSAPRPGLCQ